MSFSIVALTTNLRSRVSIRRFDFKQSDLRQTALLILITSTCVFRKIARFVTFLNGASGRSNG